MSSLHPPMLFALDLACDPIYEAFGEYPYLVGSVQERTAGPRSDVDVRLILDDEKYDALVSSPEFRTMLDIAFSAYLHAMTGLPIDFQIQRRTDANTQHAGKQRNPLGGRALADWPGDAARTITAASIARTFGDTK